MLTPLLHPTVHCEDDVRSICGGGENVRVVLFTCVNFVF